MRALLDRLWPERLRQRAELPLEKRMALWSTVGDTDNCLMAMTDLLGDMLEGNAAVLLNPSGNPLELEAARQRVSIAVELLRQIETERAQAKKWKSEQAQ